MSQRDALAKAEDGSYIAPCGVNCRLHYWDGEPQDKTEVYGAKSNDGYRVLFGIPDPHVHHGEGCRLETLNIIENLAGPNEVTISLAARSSLVTVDDGIKETLGLSEGVGHSLAKAALDAQKKLAKPAPPHKEPR